MNVEEAVFNLQKSKKYSLDHISDSYRKRGIFAFFEDGEYYENTERIVYVGVTKGKSSLLNTIINTYFGIPERKYSLINMVASAIVNKRFNTSGINGVDIEDVRNASEIKKDAFNYIKKHFRVSWIVIDDVAKRETLFNEIYSYLIDNYSIDENNTNWLGYYATDSNIRKKGMWQPISPQLPGRYVLPRTNRTEFKKIQEEAKLNRKNSGILRTDEVCEIIYRIIKDNKEISKRKLLEHFNFYDYTDEELELGIAKYNIDWDEHCINTLQKILKNDSSVSIERILQKLGSEGFTEDEINNSLISSGIKWNEQIFKKIEENLKYYPNISKRELFDKLKHSEFSEKEINSAIDSCGVNWGKQIYLRINEIINNYPGKSKSELIRSLEWNKFTKEEIEYAINQSDIDWKKQVIKRYNEILEDEPNIAKGELIRKLKFDEFTKEEIEYAIKQANIDWEKQVINRYNEILEDEPNIAKDELIWKLEFDEFTKEEIEYALKQSNIDWKEQVINRYNEILKYEKNISKDDLISTLEDDKFTKEEIEYAIKQANTDWKKQVIKRYNEILRDEPNISKDDLINKLEYDEFTKEEIEYALKQSNINWKEQVIKCYNEILKDEPNIAKGKLIKKLKEDKFSEDDINYALEKSDVEWNNQVIKHYNNILINNPSILKIELKSKLTDDGFTEEEISYALSQSTVDWNKQLSKRYNTLLKGELAKSNNLLKNDENPSLNYEFTENNLQSSTEDNNHLESPQNETEKVEDDTVKSDPSAAHNSPSETPNQSSISTTGDDALDVESNVKKQSKFEKIVGFIANSFSSIFSKKKKSSIKSSTGLQERNDLTTENENGSSPVNPMVNVDHQPGNSSIPTTNPILQESIDTKLNDSEQHTQITGVLDTNGESAIAPDVVDLSLKDGVSSPSDTVLPQNMAIGNENDGITLSKKPDEIPVIDSSKTQIPPSDNPPSPNNIEMKGEPEYSGKNAGPTGQMPNVVSFDGKEPIHFKKMSEEEAKELYENLMQNDPNADLEKEVVKQLETLQGLDYFVLHNLYIPTFRKNTTSEIDVLLIHPKGLYVFECKDYNGVLRCDVDTQKKWEVLYPSGYITTLYSPVRQNTGHINVLSEFLKISELFKSWVVFGNGGVLKIKKNTNRAIITRLADLMKLMNEDLNKSGDFFTHEEVKELYNMLYPCTQVSYEVKLKHIEDVANSRIVTGSSVEFDDEDTNDAYSNEVDDDILSDLFNNPLIKNALKEKNKRDSEQEAYPDMRDMKDEDSDFETESKTGTSQPHISRSVLIRLAKSAGAEDLDDDALEAYSFAVEEYARKLSIRANEIAKHCGRKTLRYADVRLAE